MAEETQISTPVESADVNTSSEENLRNIPKRVNVDDVVNDIKGTFDQYQGENINPARNMTGNLEENLIDLVNSGRPQFEYSDYVNLNQDGTIKPYVINNRNLNKSYKTTRGVGKDIKNIVFQQPNNEILENIYNNEKANLSKSSLSKMINSATKNNIEQIKGLNIPKEAQQQLFDDSREIITHVKDLYNNSVPILKHQDTKGLPRTMNRYAIPVDINGNRYNVMLSSKMGNLDDVGILYDLNSKASGSNSLGNPSQYQMPDTSINDLVDFVNTNTAKYRDSLSPIDLQKIKQQVGQMTNWADTTRPKIQNTVLEQVYGKLRNRLEDLSPELAQANKEYAALKGFQEDEGLKTILAPGGGQ